jgi:hypothetical protein
MSKGLKIYLWAIAIISIIAIGVSCMLNDSSPSSTTTSSNNYSKEVRCWYCSKVIVNEDGKVIHATHQYLDTYKCDYCGKENVIK